jgi:hypothetical protein
MLFLHELPCQNRYFLKQKYEQKSHRSLSAFVIQFFPGVLGPGPVPVFVREQVLSAAAVWRLHFHDRYLLNISMTGIY